MILISAKGAVGPVAGAAHLAQAAICQTDQFFLGDFVPGKYLGQQNIENGNGQLDGGTRHTQNGDIP